MPISVVSVTNPIRTTLTEALYWFPTATGWHVVAVSEQDYIKAHTRALIDLEQLAAGSIVAPNAEVTVDPNTNRVNWHLAPAAATASDYSSWMVLGRLYGQALVKYVPSTHTLTVGATRVSKHFSGEARSITVGADGLLYAACGWAEPAGTRTGGAIDAASHTLTVQASTSWAYPLGIGDTIIIPGAGVAGADLTTRITAGTEGGTSFTVADAASTTVSGKTISRSGLNDGKICVLQITPATGAVVEYGPLGTKQNPQEVNGIACDGTYIYVCGGRNPYEVLKCPLADPIGATATQIVNAGAAYTTLASYKGGGKMAVTWGTSNRRGYWLYNGSAYASATGNGVDPQVTVTPGPTTGNLSGGAQGTPPWPGGSLDDATAWAPAVAKPSVTESRTQMPDAQGNVPTGACSVTVNGHTANWTVPLYQTNLQRPYVLSDARVYATAGSYVGAAIYNPATEAYPWLGGPVDLSPYDAVRSGTKLYQGGYPSGLCDVFDEGVPYSLTNPSVLFTVAGDFGYPATHIFRMAIAGGKLYAVCWDERSGYNGGTLISWNLTTGAKGVLRTLAFDGYRSWFIAASPNGLRIAVSTSRDVAIDGSKPAQGGVFIVGTTGTEDTEAHFLTNLERRIDPVAGSKGAGSVRWVSNTQIVGWCAKPTGTNNADSTTESYLYRRNADTGAQEQIVTLPVACPWNYSAGNMGTPPNAFVLHSDGYLYLWMGTTLYRIDPLDLTSQVAVYQLASGLAGDIAFSGQRVYIGNNVDLRYADGVGLPDVPPPPPVAPVVSFVADNTTPQATQVVTFDSSASTGEGITARTTNFGDGTTSTDISPTHAYAAAGTYTVWMEWTNAGGTNRQTRTNYIVVSAAPAPPAAPVARITPSVGPLADGVIRIAQNGTLVLTDATVEQVDTRVWEDLSSGATSADAEVSFTFHTRGRHVVRLTATNAGGSSTSEIVVWVQAPPQVFLVA